MSNRSHLLDLPNDTDQPGLLFHLGPSSTSSVADGISAENGHPNDMAPSQEPMQSDATPMSPSGQGTVYNEIENGGFAILSGIPASPGHHPVATGLGAPRWNSHEMNQWPHRLFTTAPPTPSGGYTLPLGSFRVPPKQQDLEDLQNPSQPPPIDPRPRFIGQLSPTNLQIYNNCRGNRTNLWPRIAEEIYNLQARYGELIIPVPGSERDPRYTCGICSHHTTTNPVHIKPKRRWDSSPDILSHGIYKIKPWFSNCGAAFPRNRDQRRHSARCQICKVGQRSCASPVQSSAASSPTFSPRLSLPAIPLHETMPQGHVMPHVTSNHNTHPGGYPAPSQSNMFPVRELAPPPPLTYIPWPQPSDSQWARQGVPYPQGPWARSYHESYGVFDAQGEYTYTPGVNHIGGNPYPSYHYIDFGTSRGIAPLVYPGHFNGLPHMGCPLNMPTHQEYATLGSNILAPTPSQVGAPASHQDSWVQDGSYVYGEKVRTIANVSGMPAEKCCGSLEGRRKRIARSYRLTAAFLILLILCAMFWFFIRYFLRP